MDLLDYEIDLGIAIVSMQRKQVYNERPFPNHVDDYHYEYIAKVIYDDNTFRGEGFSETEALQNLSTKIKLAKELK